MKTFMKRMMALLLLLGMLCGLCGCEALEELRHCQAFLQEDGSISWNGAVYKPLPETELLRPSLDFETEICATAPDVPVLLSLFYAQYYLNPSTDGVFLEDEWYNYYCRIDAYDNLISRLREPFVPEKMCYYYDVYDEDDWSYTEERYVLTEAEVAALGEVSNTVTPVSAMEYAYPDYDYSVYLYECSADLLLHRSQAELAAAGDHYYLMLYTLEDVLVYAVPESYADICGKILQAYEAAAFGTEEIDPEQNV